MRILSVQQPWAWALVSGPKRIENRTWATPYRGPLLVHAGRTPRPATDYPGKGCPPAAEWPLGAVVGLVDLVDCVEYYELVRSRRGVGFAEGPYCWVVANPRPLPDPIPLKGRLGLWAADTALVAAVRAQLSRERTPAFS